MAENVTKVAQFAVAAVIAAVVMTIVAMTFLGLCILAPVIVFLPRLLRAAQHESFKPTDEDLHAWIEGRRD